jgi:hypothetical protein
MLIDIFRLKRTPIILRKLVVPTKQCGQRRTDWQFVLQDALTGNSDNLS